MAHGVLRDQSTPSSLLWWLGKVLCLWPDISLSADSGPPALPCPPAAVPVSGSLLCLLQYGLSS